MKHQPTPGAGQRGFTIVELMITMLIAAILMAVAVPSFRNMTATSRLSSQTMDMIGAVNIARSEAIKRNGAVTLCRVTLINSTSCANSTATTWSFWIISSAGGTIIKRDTINTFGGTMKVASNFTNDAITFGSDGMAHHGITVTGTLLNSNFFSICSTRPQNNNNLRQAALGAGSRITTTKSSGTC